MTPSPGLMAYVLGRYDAGRIMSLYLGPGTHDRAEDMASIEFSDGKHEIPVSQISSVYEPDNQCTARPIRECKVTQFDERRSKEEWE